LTKSAFPGRIMAMPIVSTPTYPKKSTAEEVPIGIEARGSIEKVRTYQITTVTIDGDMQNRRHVQQQKAYHVPYDPKSEGQLARRQVFRDGAAAWKALPEEDKEAWNEAAEEEFKIRSRQPGSWRYHTGCNLFMSEYLNSH